MVYLTNVIGNVLINLLNRLMSPINDACGTSGMVAATFNDGVHDMLNGPDSNDWRSRKANNRLIPTEHASPAESAESAAMPV